MTRTVMWGERGLVATLFLELSARDSNVRWRRFLDALDVPGLEGEIADVWAVVEPDFGTKGFGHPDAIARVELTGRPPAVLMFEAKIGCYEESSRLPSARGEEGYNSKLNGQLELNHCFVEALREYREEDGAVCDPDWVAHTPYVKARGGRKRSLKNAIVLEALVQRLCDVPGGRFFHVAITNDVANPFRDRRLQPLMPEIYTRAGEAEPWEPGALRFGWVSWEALRRLSRDDEAPWAMFEETFELNAAKLDPEEADVDDSCRQAWPLDRAYRGRSVVYAPALCSNSFLHFSWRYNSYRLRTPSGEELKELEVRGEAPGTLDVLPLIMREEPAAALSVDKCPQRWLSILRSRNRQYGLKDS